ASFETSISMGRAGSAVVARPPAHPSAQHRSVAPSAAAGVRLSFRDVEWTKSSSNNRLLRVARVRVELEDTRPLRVSAAHGRVSSFAFDRDAESTFETVDKSIAPCVLVGVHLRP